MFNAFEYFETIYAAVGLLKIYKASGISKVEELLSDLTQNPDNCLVVRDSGDGSLDFKSRRLDTGYHTLYVFHRGKFNDHTANLTAKRNAMIKAIALFDLMKQDAVDFGDAAFGFDDSKVLYAEIGPIGIGYYGYSFSFTMDHSF